MLLDLKELYWTLYNHFREGRKSTEWKYVSFNHSPLEHKHQVVINVYLGTSFCVHTHFTFSVMKLADLLPDETLHCLFMVVLHKFGSVLRSRQKMKSCSKSLSFQPQCLVGDGAVTAASLQPVWVGNQKALFFLWAKMLTKRVAVYCTTLSPSPEEFELYCMSGSLSLAIIKQFLHRTSRPMRHALRQYYEKKWIK